MRLTRVNKKLMYRGVLYVINPHQLNQPSATLSTFIKKIAEKHAYAAAETAVGDIQDDKCQWQQPKKADGQFQEKVDKP